MVATVNASTSAGVVITPDNSGVLAFQSSSATALTIDASQNSTFVGTASATKLIPTGSSATGNGLYLPAANSLGLSTNGTNAVYIDSSQNVGIGTTSPATKLEVASPASTSVVLRLASNKTGTGAGDKGRLDFYSADNSGTAYQLGYMDVDRSDGTATASYIAWANRVSSTVAERMRIDSSGNLLVGNSSAGGTGWSLYPSGYSITNGATSTFTHMSFQTSSSQKGYIQTVGATTNYNGSSDYRLKKNVIPLPNALQTIAQLKPVKFNWIEDDSVAYSFIAHELQEVVPQAVGGTKDEVDENGKPVYQGIDPSKLVCFLTAAIQELKAINDTQAETINALTARIVALETA